MLLLGPLLRYVDATSATIWVETDGPGTVTVTAGGHSGSAATFGAHGHHYALVEVTGLEPGAKTPYTVAVDGEEVWPSREEELAGFPPSVIPTLQPGKPLRSHSFGTEISRLDIC